MTNFMHSGNNVYQSFFQPEKKRGLPDLEFGQKLFKESNEKAVNGESTTSNNDLVGATLGSCSSPRVTFPQHMELLFGILESKEKSAQILHRKYSKLTLENYIVTKYNYGNLKNITVEQAWLTLQKYINELKDPLLTLSTAKLCIQVLDQKQGKSVEKCAELISRHLLQGDDDKERNEKAVRYNIFERLIKMLNAIVHDKHLKYNVNTSSELLANIWVNVVIGNVGCGKDNKILDPRNNTVWYDCNCNFDKPLRSFKKLRSENLICYSEKPCDNTRMSALQKSLGLKRRLYAKNAVNELLIFLVENHNTIFKPSAAANQTNNVTRVTPTTTTASKKKSNLCIFTL